MNCEQRCFPEDELLLKMLINVTLNNQAYAVWYFLVNFILFFCMYLILKYG